MTRLAPLLLLAACSCQALNVSRHVLNQPPPFRSVYDTGGPDLASAKPVVQDEPFGALKRWLREMDRR